MLYKVKIPCEYISGYVRLGELEGVVEANSYDEALQMAQEHNEQLDLIVKDFVVNDYELDMWHARVDLVEEEEE